MNKGLVVFDQSNSRPLDVICVGRVAVDLYAEQIGASLEDAQTFRKYLGGCAGNIAVGTARLGLKSALFSRVGADAMGSFLLKQLHKEGVDTRLVRGDDKHLTGLVLLGVNPPDDFPLIFYRNQCADEQIKLEDLTNDVLNESKSLLLTGTLFAKAHLRQLAFDAIAKAKRAQCKIILDIDYRPVLWGLATPGDGATRFVAAESVSEVLRDALQRCDMIVGTEEEVRIASGQSKVEEAVSAITAMTKATLVVKKGERGCEAILTDKQRVVVPAYPTKVLNVLGAGDAFMSGLLYGVFRGETIGTALQYANACGSIVVSRHGCSPAMPYEDEMKALVEGVPKRSSHLFSKGGGTTSDLFIAAFDHRDFFDDAADVARIEEFKQAIARALPASAGMLIDPICGMNALKRASHREVLVGVPIEKAGAFPLEWIARKPLYQQILERPPTWFVKVLVRLHPLMDEGQKTEQLRKLTELYQCCEALERKFMLELLLPQSDACKDADVADGIELIYKHHIMPTWWKIEAPPTQRAWQKVNEVLHEFDQSARVIILGKNKSFDELQKDFERVASTPNAIGFAVGRTLFADAWYCFKQDECSADEAGQMVVRNFEHCVSLWKQASQTQRMGS